MSPFISACLVIGPPASSGTNVNVAFAPPPPPPEDDAALVALLVLSLPHAAASSNATTAVPRSTRIGFVIKSQPFRRGWMSLPPRQLWLSPSRRVIPVA